MAEVVRPAPRVCRIRRGLPARGANSTKESHSASQARKPLALVAGQATRAGATRAHVRRPRLPWPWSAPVRASLAPRPVFEGSGASWRARGANSAEESHSAAAPSRCYLVGYRTSKARRRTRRVLSARLAGATRHLSPSRWFVAVAARPFRPPPATYFTAGGDATSPRAADASGSRPAGVSTARHSHRPRS